MNRNWKCKFCGCDALDMLGVQSAFLRCLVCLRVEGYEDAYCRNVRVTVTGRENIKEGDVYALDLRSFARLALKELA